MTPLIRRFTSARSDRQRGAAAVELAILIPILIVILAPLILYARYMWHYTVVHRAAQDAAQYLATVPKAEMNSRLLAGRAKDVAVEIVKTELADLAPEDALYDPGVYCDTEECGSVAGAPQTVRVLVSFEFYDNIFHTYLGPRGFTIEANVTMSYVGK